MQVFLRMEELKKKYPFSEDYEQIKKDAKENLNVRIE